VIKSRNMRSAGYVASMRGKRGAHMVSVSRPEQRRPFGRSWRRWEDNIKMELQEVGWGCMEWIDLAQDREKWLALLNALISLRVP
jgi:hypothetical protein